MPPRRAAKAAPVSGDAKAEGKKQPSKATKATKPASKPSAKPASKPAARSRATKRAAEAEDDDEHRDTSAAPPTKRRKAAAKGDKDVAEPQPKPKSTSRKVAKVGSNDTLVEEENIEKKGEKPKAEKFKLPKDHTFFNPLPSPPTHLRPAPVLFVWGAGNFGQFAMGEDHLGELEKPTRNKLIEQKIEEGAFGEEGAGLESVAAGGMYTLFVDEQGTIWSSGTNDDAALGRITTEVPNPEKEGEFLDVDTLTAQPWPLQSLKDEGFRATRLAAGDSISAALSADGELRVWGSFRSVEGLLGFSNGQKHQFLPVPILDIKSKPNDPERFSSVVAGNNHLVVLTTHGHIYTWGAGEQGQLGRKVLERRKIHGTTPERIVLGTRSRKAVTVGAGNYTSFAVDDKGDVWAWGLNNMGQTGTGFDESEVQLPKKVVGLSKEDLGGDDIVVQIAGGEHHTIFLTGKGKVYACGRSNGGQLGIPEDDPVLVERDEEHKDMLNTPHLVPFPDGDDPVVQISAGIHNNLAVTEGGALLTWGTGPQSELGAGDESELKTPKVIVRKEGGAWSALQGSCGGQHTVALLRKKI